MDPVAQLVQAALADLADQGVFLDQMGLMVQTVQGGRPGRQDQVDQADHPGLVDPLGLAEIMVLGVLKAQVDRLDLVDILVPVDL